MSKVKLRRKAISGGRNTLYLDIYPPIPNPDTGRLQRKYYLKVFLYAKPRTELERMHNSETTALAECERAQRQLDVQNMRFNFLSQKMLKGNFIKFFECERDLRAGSNSDNWKMAVAYFKEFAGESILFPQINETFCEEYADYLLSAPSIGRAGIKIKINTAVSYFAKFRATLKEAFKQKYLPVNIGEIIDAITPEDTHREYLFLDEVQALADTPCACNIIKKAALFSALTGLRFSDIHTLQWEELRGAEGNYSIQFSVDKTRSAEYLPISDQAYEFLGPPATGTVFRDFKYHRIEKILRDWLSTAGITKHITFHCFRHTFATLQLLLGTDIVTVSKMLGHKDIKTTMIYVKIVDKLKRDASSRITLSLGADWLILKKAS